MPTEPSRCPCCDRLVAASSCPDCGHCWHASQAISPATNYTEKSGRNAMPPRFLQRKLAERTTAIAPRLRRGARVLEVGCAEGDLARSLKSSTHLEYWGIEPSRDAQVACAVLDKVLPDIRAIPATTPQFDCILSFHVLEHVRDLADELTQWHRLLAPDGWVMVEVPCRSGHTDLETDRNPEHLHQFSPASLTLRLERSGFDVLSLTRGHFESPVYNDSLRALAARRTTAALRQARLLQRFSALKAPFAVFGLGGDFRNYVQPLLDQLPVVALIDSQPEPRPGLPAGLDAEVYDPGRHGKMPVLVCSLRHETSILADLAHAKHPPQLIYLLADLFQTPSGA